MLFLLLAILVSSTACTQTSTGTTTDTSDQQEQDPVLSPQEFNAVIEKGEAILVDVRTPQEFTSGHIPGSMNLDWTAPDYEAKFATLDPKRTVLLYCAMGGRSDQARAYLQGKGFNVLELEDGIASWKKAGLPLER